MSREIVLSDVPDKAADAFDEYADKEFDGDRSMALRELVVREKLRSEVRGVAAQLRERMQRLEQRIEDIEQESTDTSDDTFEPDTIG